MGQVYARGNIPGLIFVDDSPYIINRNVIASFCNFTYCTRYETKDNTIKFDSIVSTIKEKDNSLSLLLNLKSKYNAEEMAFDLYFNLYKETDPESTIIDNLINAVCTLNDNVDKDIFNDNHKFKVCFENGDILIDTKKIISDESHKYVYALNIVFENCSIVDQHVRVTNYILGDTNQIDLCLLKLKNLLACLEICFIKAKEIKNTFLTHYKTK